MDEDFENPRNEEDEQEEEDDDEEMGRPVYNVVVRWSRKVRGEMLLNPDLNIECHTFILGIGQLACCFLDAYVIPERCELIGAVSCGHGSDREVDLNTIGQRNPMDRTCLVYRSTKDPGVIYCLNNIHVPPELAFFFGEKVLGVLTRSKLEVGILCSHNAADYKTADESESLDLPLIRCLRTEQYTAQAAFAYLEQPNFISGVPASALQFCQVYKIPGVIYSSYNESLSHPDPENIKAFAPVLASSPFDKLEPKPDAEERVSHLCRAKDDDGNSLYM